MYAGFITSISALYKNNNITSNKVLSSSIN